MSLSISLLYFVVDKSTALWFLIPITLAFVIVDVAIHRSGVVREFILRFFGSLMRSHELRVDKFMLNGATYVLLSACMCVIVFPKIIAITAFTILIVSDICAALIGRRYGKHPFLDKSLEGTIAFAVSAFIVVFIIARSVNAPFSYVLSGCIASVIGALVENVSPRLKLDDNVSIPVSIGATQWIFGLTLYVQSEPFLSLLK